MHAAKIVAVSVCFAVIYGILHDQVTARVCVEYFTIGHPRVVDTEDPTLLAIVWGVLATWWVGLLLGIPLAIAARFGSRPKRTARELVRPIAELMCVAAICAAVAGILGALVASHGHVSLVGPLAWRVPREMHVRFIADLWAHLASYGAGFVGGIIVIVTTWRARNPTRLRSTAESATQHDERTST